MDSSAPTASPVKQSSGIPRFSTSKLPTSRTASVIPSSAQDARSLLPSPAKNPSARASPVKASLIQPSTISKRSSIVGPPSQVPPSKISSHRATQSVHGFGAKTSIYGAVPDSRPSSRLARPPARKAPSSFSSVPRPEDADDQLGSLDGFRSASRQSNRPETPSLDEPQFVIAPDQPTTRIKKSSRPSLSDRTVESISRLPPTPTTERRRSSFFVPPSPMGPPSRPASAMSTSMRPGTSDGTGVRPFSRQISPYKQAPASAKPSSRMSIDYSAARSTPSRSGINRPIPNTVQPAPRLQGSLVTRPSSKLASRTAGSRLPGTPGTTAPRTTIPASNFGHSVKKALPAVAGASRRMPESSRPPAQPSPKASNSSAALRDQIAKAKAAKRAVASKSGLPQVDGGVDDEFDLSADPFNAKPKDNNGLLLKRIDAARADGRLNIAAMGLKSIPGQVLCMYDADEMAKSNITWSETVDLTRLVAADNELETISDDIFPDLDTEALTPDDDDESAKGLQFRGLDVLDLHGNMLTTIPVGLKRLERLTVVNLSHNKLNNVACETLSQVETLKELRLGHNNLTGYLPQSLNRLHNLRVLDLQSNKLLSLPECVRELVNLQVLNICNNQLTGLPMDALEALPLTELAVANNAMVGALFPFSVAGLSHLQYLDVSNNSLASLAFSESVSLPSLKSLSIANNRIVALPDVTGWTELVSIAAGDNKISALPEGFATLAKLKQVDLTGNDIAKLNDEIGLMGSLESLKIGANPLKERKLLTLTTEELKRELRDRLKPGSRQAQDDDFEDEGIDIESPGHAQLWKVSLGKLDLTDKGIGNEDADDLRSFLGANHEVRDLVLAKNRLSMIPFEICAAQNLRSLDISNCSLDGEFLTDMVNFQFLQELNISSNRISSWEMLLELFQAPRLSFLDVSNNRLVGSLPVLKSSYPELQVFHGRDNRIDAISAEALQGLHAVDLSNNNIGYLPPEVGLLWEQGLKGFSIGGNAFRVPNYRVLEKGTETTLAWLREKIPEYERASEEMF